MGKASKRHKIVESMPELNLNPMMDLFAVLIPALLMMSAVVEVTVLEVKSPSSDSSDSAPPPEEKIPLNLTVIIREDGYIVTGAGGVFSGTGAQVMPAVENQGVTIPISQRNVSCSRYRNTRPPPRKLNQKEQQCTKSDDGRMFWAYDLEALTKKVIEIKDEWPEEKAIIIKGDSQIEYEALIDVMDATRDVKDQAKGEIRPLFTDVMIGINN